MPRPPSGSNFNIADLERILNDRRSELNKLQKQRAELERRIDELDKRITKLGGVSPNGRGGGGGGRVKNAKSLVQTIEEVMTASGKPMRVPEIFEAVLASGYKTNSTNPKGIVNQALIKEKRFGQVDRGVYQLIKK